VIGASWSQDFLGQEILIKLGLQSQDWAMSMFKFFFEEFKLVLVMNQG
jgi:hypothetical protein